MKPLFNSHMLLSEHFSLSEMLASETADITIPRRHWPFDRLRDREWWLRLFGRLRDREWW
jgi:hypothetical protein